MGEVEKAECEELKEAGVGDEEIAAAFFAIGRERAALKKLLISGKRVFALFLEGEEEGRILSFSCVRVRSWWARVIA